MTEWIESKRFIPFHALVKVPIELWAKAIFIGCARQGVAPPTEKQDRGDRNIPIHTEGAFGELFLLQYLIGEAAASCRRQMFDPRGGAFAKGPDYDTGQECCDVKCQTNRHHNQHRKRQYVTLNARAHDEKSFDEPWYYFVFTVTWGKWVRTPWPIPYGEIKKSWLKPWPLKAGKEPSYNKTLEVFVEMYDGGPLEEFEEDSFEAWKESEVLAVMPKVRGTLIEEFPSLEGYV